MSRWAIAALGCGAVLLILIPAWCGDPVRSIALLPIAVVVAGATIALGFIARAKTDRDDRRSLRAAWIAIIAGLAMLSMLFSAAIVLPTLGKPREPAQRILCASNLRQIGEALNLYASDHAGAYPPSLDLLPKTYDLDWSVFTCPDTYTPSATGATLAQQRASFRAGGHCDYVYLAAGLSLSAVAPQQVIAYEPLSNHANAGMNVLYGDGSVAWLGAAQARQLIASLPRSSGPTTAQDD